MKQISSAEASEALRKWSTDSLVGCIYTVATKVAVFSLRRRKLEVGDDGIFVGSEAIFARLPENAPCFLMAPLEIPPDTDLAKRMGSLNPKAILKVVFPNEDVCLFFPERPARRGKG